jgi:hypothetical protein
MGSSNSSQAPTVVVRLDQNIAIAGSASPLSGKVYIDVPKTYMCNALDLCLQGYEATEVTYAQQDNNEPGKEKRITARETRYFLDQPMLLSRVTQGGMARGNYEFPFRIFIPAGVLGTHKEKAYQIGYRLKASLSKVVSDPKPVTSTIDFTVISGVPSIPVHPLSFEPRAYPVMFCCCFDRGVIAFGALVSSSNICPGENLSIALSAINASSATVHGISVELVRNTRITAADSNGNHVSEWSECVVSKYKDSNALDSLPLASAQTPQISGIVTSSPIQTDLIARINSDVSSQKCVYTLPIPNMCFPSYSGMLISVKYELRIIVVNNFIANNIRMSQPVHVVTRHPESTPMALGYSVSPCLPMRPIYPPMAQAPQASAPPIGHPTTGPPTDEPPPPYEAASAPMQQPPHASYISPAATVPMSGGGPTGGYADLPQATAVEYAQLPPGWAPICSQVVVIGPENFGAAGKM